MPTRPTEVPKKSKKELEKEEKARKKKEEQERKVRENIAKQEDELLKKAKVSKGNKFTTREDKNCISKKVSQNIFTYTFRFRHNGKAGKNHLEVTTHNVFFTIKK